MRKFHQANKENAHHANVRRTPKFKTPPRERNRNNQNVILKEEQDDVYSFQKLRGAVQKFEQTQNQHYLKYENLKSSTDQFSKDCANIGEIVSPNRDPAAQSLSRATCNATPKMVLQQQERLVDKRRPNNGKGDTSSPANSSKSEEMSHKDEFSFVALKQRAQYLEENNGGIITQCGNAVLSSGEPGDVEEDFSFKKLKERAIQSSTPSKCAPTAPSTPLRTPIRTHKMAITPQTGGKNKSIRTPIRTPIRTSSKTPLPCRRNRLPMPSSPFLSAPMPSNSSTSIFPSVSIHPSPATSKKELASSKSGPIAFNPNRFKFTNKIRKEEVQATDETIASVKKLSQWLGDDPFEKKKQIVIRKGEQISKKAQAFEHEELLNCATRRKDISKVQNDRQHFPEGKVSQGKSWLKSAFGESEEEDCKNEPNDSVFERKRILETSFLRIGGKPMFR
uniref:Uncharacterized protein n=1 Tax=Chaetoceros debilis TaxID=122233 RepID=A0A7S3PYR9_9STRA|mmetsp:Transcript_4102/g.6044  ORF Transcript_4102/g.6044 Transcript_4102/m.6044 type:complete len:449 (-) Transcript_4102:376-1722(-)